MGLANDDRPTWLRTSCALSQNSRLRLAKREETEIQWLMAGTRNRLDLHIETKLIVEDYDVDHVIRDDIKPEFFLELKGAFVLCPHCTDRDGWIRPIREGQLVSARKQCWTS
jgi:hypothetical protein